MGNKIRHIPKKALSRKKREREVTRDSVIITRDLHVIRNHTNYKSQGTKIREKQHLEQRHKVINFTNREQTSRTKGRIFVIN